MTLRAYAREEVNKDMSGNGRKELLADLAKGPQERVKPVRRKLGRKEWKFIYFCELFYFQSNNGFPTPEQAAVALGYSVSEINVFLQNINVRKALEERGLPYKIAGATPNGELTPTQIAAGLTVANFADSRTIERKLDELGVRPIQYYAWLDNPRFKKFVNDRASANLVNVRPEAVAEYCKLIRQGDIKAITHYFEVTGEFKANGNDNVVAMLQMVIESIQRHVKDPAVLAAISADLLGAAPVAGQNVKVEIEA